MNFAVFYPKTTKLSFLYQHRPCLVNNLGIFSGKEESVPESSNTIKQAFIECFDKEVSIICEGHQTP